MKLQLLKIFAILLFVRNIVWRQPNEGIKNKTVLKEKYNQIARSFSLSKFSDEMLFSQHVQ